MEDNLLVESPKERQSPLERYFAIIEMVAAHPGTNAGELAELCALPFPTVHRLLLGLRKSGLLIGGDRRKGYELGPRLLRLLQTGSDDFWIRITVQKKLDEVAERLSATCYLAKLVHDKVVSVAWAAPASGLRGHVVPGLSQPLHAAACAKAILAFYPDTFVRSLLPDPLPKLCVNTCTRVEDVLDQMHAAKEVGYATCINENEAGITAIACPIPLADIGVIYSIGFMTLGDSLPERRISEVASVLKQAAASLATTASPQRIREANG